MLLLAACSSPTRGEEGTVTIAIGSSGMRWQTQF